MRSRGHVPVGRLRLIEGEYLIEYQLNFFFSCRRRHTRWTGDWSSDVCSSDLMVMIRSLPVRSKARMTFLSAAYALPCNTALTAPSRTAIEICMISSSGKPSSVAIRVAFSSALSIVSNEESSVYETRCSVMAIDDVY